MGRIVISGASGDLGRRITEELLQRNPTAELTLVTRTPSKLSHRVSANIEVRRGDYTEPASLDEAYAGGETLMLISGLNVGRRVQEHRNAIAAAKKAGIQHVVYTSANGIHPRNPSLAVQDHYQTELDLRASGLQVVLLRDSFYAELFATAMLGSAIPAGEFSMAAGEGWVAPVSKRDVVRCLVTCLLDPRQHVGAVYELTGPELLSLHDMARMASELYGVPFKYKEITPEERLAILDAMGYPRTYSADMAENPDGALWASDEMLAGDAALKQGYHALLSHHVEMLTGQKAESLWSVMTRCKGMRYDETWTKS